MTPSQEPSPGHEDPRQRIHALEQKIAVLGYKEAFLNRLLVAMTLLARTRSLAEGNLTEAFQDITRLASRSLEVQRCSVWLFTEGRASIRCACLFDWRDNAHSNGSELLALQYPSYFEEIERGRIIAAENAPADPRTREFREGYLEPLGITSMLDVPLKHRDRLAGVLCFEHTGPHRPWLPEEQQFAAFASSLVTLAMDVSERLA